MKRFALIGLLVGCGVLCLSLRDLRRDPAPPEGRVLRAVTIVFTVFFGAMYVISAW